MTSYHRFYEVVRRIPHGRVATYGQVAMLAGAPGRARQVGYALAALPAGHPVPWQRVVNAQGRISLRGDGSGHDLLQKVMLRREGVRFSKSGTISLVAFQWRPKAAGPG
ncbi:MAG TPA: MGMT family protein [Thermoanaerobaculia bacterium]|jgi:methylated-DNA-protein-cysteine methyltransferase-like protein